MENIISFSFYLVTFFRDVLIIIDTISILVQISLSLSLSLYLSLSLSLFLLVQLFKQRATTISMIRI